MRLDSQGVRPDAGSSGWTEGSLFFGNASQRAVQDNANAFWDNVDKRVHFGPRGGSPTTGVLNVYGTTIGSGAFTGAAFIPFSATIPANGMYLPAANSVGFATNTVSRGYISSAGLWHVGADGGSPTTGTLNVYGAVSVVDGSVVWYSATTPIGHAQAEPVGGTSMVVLTGDDATRSIAVKPFNASTRGFIVQGVASQSEPLFDLRGSDNVPYITGLVRTDAGNEQVLWTVRAHASQSTRNVFEVQD